jgi:DNA-binding transcriptional ArsR family regulator
LEGFRANRYVLGLVVVQAGWLEAVANPIRLRIVRHLSDCESASLDDLSKAVSAQRNTVRAHLRALIGAGVVARLPGQSDGSLGRPPARYRLDRRDIPRSRRREEAPGARSPVAVVVRDYPGGVPAWTLREPEWAAAVYLLESPWLAQSRGRNASRAIDYERRAIDWGALEREARTWPRAERLLLDIARGLFADEARGPVAAVARALAPDQRARVLAAIALAAGDARVVGVAGSGEQKSA